MISGKRLDICYTVLLLMALFLLTAGYSQPANAQRQFDRRADGRKEAIEARKISYITTKLSLTPEEAREFWPIYNEYTQKVENLSQNFRSQQDRLPEPEDMNKEEAAQYVEAELTRFEDAAALRREYAEKMRSVISIQQLALLYDAERSFNRMLFREAQRRHRQGGREDQRN